MGPRERPELLPLPVLLVHGGEASRQHKPQPHILRQQPWATGRDAPPANHTQIRGQRGQQRFTEKQHPSWWDHMVWKLIIFLMISDGSVWACKSEGNSPGHSKLTVVYSIKSLKRSWLSFGPCWLAVSQNFPGRVWELGQAKGHSSWAISHFSVNSYYSALSWVHASW